MLLIIYITTECSKNVVNEECIEESAKATDMYHKDSAACLVDKDGNWIHSTAGYHFTYITCGDKTEVSVKFSIYMFKSGKNLKQVESVE